MAGAGVSIDLVVAGSMPLCRKGADFLKDVGRRRARNDDGAIERQPGSAGSAFEQIIAMIESSKLIQVLEHPDPER
jgi:hypothetical protein